MGTGPQPRSALHHHFLIDRPRIAVNTLFLLLGLLDTTVAFLIWHYAFWGIWGFSIFCLVIYMFGISLFTACCLIALYWLQIAFWTPQYHAGLTWYKHVLYNPLLDAHYYYFGSTIIREGNFSKVKT